MCIRKLSKFPGYSISDQGEVINLKTNKILKCSKDRDGYLQLSISSDNKSYSRRIHRLIAETFIPNPENKPQVNHIDGNKLNNHISNLEWVTAKENIRHSWSLGLSKSSENQRKAVIESNIRRRTTK